MNINATIIVQMINFFITYWMLRLFLFKPVITIIEHESAEKASLLSIIEQQQKSLAIQEKERQRLWYMCQEYFMAHQPEVEKNVPPFTDGIEHKKLLIKPLSESALAAIIADTQKVIVEKITHVH